MSAITLQCIILFFVHFHVFKYFLVNICIDDIDKFGWTKKNLLERDLQIDAPGLYQLSYNLALHWRSPYFANIFVWGRQS